MSTAILTPALGDYIAIDVQAPTSMPPSPEGHVGRPLNAEQAEARMDREGMVTVTLRLNQENYFNHVVLSMHGGGTTPEDYAHQAAFSFGRPDESSAEIVGVCGTDFIVSYTTHIREFLDD